MAAKGGALAEITVGDVLELLDAERAVRARRYSGAAVFFRMLHEMGVFGPGVPDLARVLDTGPAQPRGAGRPLPDRLPPGPGPARGLPEGTSTRPGLHAAWSRSNYLGKSSGQTWNVTTPASTQPAPARRGRRRLETAAAHHDDDGRPPRPAREPVTVERLNYRECLTSVRAFYLDLAHWALDDPARWGQWVAPCPVGDEELSDASHAPPQGPDGRPHP